MKKIFAILIAVTLVFSLVACGGGNGGGSQGGGLLDSKGKFEKVVDEYLADGEFSITYEIPEIDGPVECMFSGEHFYMHMTSEGQEVMLINNTDGMFMLLPSLNAYMAFNSEDLGEEAMAENPFEDLTGDTLGEYTEGKMEIDGVSYDYEEYKETVDEVEYASRYLFDGDTLVYIVSDPESENQMAMKVVELSNDVDKTLLEIPEGYQSFNM